MARGDVTKQIEKIVQKMGHETPASEIHEALEAEKFSCSMPMIYKVIESMKNAELEAEEENFSRADHARARAFVEAVGSWSKAKNLIEFLKPLPE